MVGWFSHPVWVLDLFGNCCNSRTCFHLKCNNSFLKPSCMCIPYMISDLIEPAMSLQSEGQITWIGQSLPMMKITNDNKTVETRSTGAIFKRSVDEATFNVRLIPLAWTVVEYKMQFLIFPKSSGFLRRCFWKKKMWACTNALAWSTIWASTDGSIKFMHYVCGVQAKMILKNFWICHFWSSITKEFISGASFI